MKRPILRASFLSRNWSGSKFFTSAAIWQAKPAASKLVMRSTPLLPANSACQASSTLLPTAQMTPIPVTTTRRCKLLRSFRVRADVVDGVLDGTDLLRVLVGNLDLEGLFKGHDQLHRVQGVRAEIVHKRSVRRDLALVYAQLLHNDLLYPFLNGCHIRSSPFALRFPLCALRSSPFVLAACTRPQARHEARRYCFALACWSMYVTASCTVRIFSASSSGISISKASSKAMTSSTVSSESAPRSSTNEAAGVTSASSTPNCSTMICFTRSSIEAIDSLSCPRHERNPALSPTPRRRSWAGNL